MKHHSLKSQLTLWTVLLVVVPSLLIMAIYISGQIMIARQQNLEIVKQRVYSQAKLIDYWMAERSNDIRVLSRSEAFRTGDERQMKQIIDAAQQTNVNFDSLSYIDNTGLFRMSTLSTGIKYPMVVDRPYFQAALAGREYMSDVVIGKNSGFSIINFSSPVFDHAGIFQGLILGSIRTMTLESLLSDNQIGQTGEVILVDRKGIMLTESRYVNQLIAKGIVQDTAKMKLMINDDVFNNIRLGDSGTATWRDYLGNNVLGAYSDVPVPGWTLIGKINESEILAPMYRQLAMMTGGTIFLVLLILSLAAQITNRIKRFIDWLSEQAGLVALGEYAKVDSAKYPEFLPTELNLFCETFVAMSCKIENAVGQLEEKESMLEGKVVEVREVNEILQAEVIKRHTAQIALQKLNDDLETRVLERTRELQNLNAMLEDEIDEREAAQKELYKINAALTISEARYRALFEHMQNSFNIRKVIVDAAGRPVDLKYVDVNPAFEKMYGLCAGDVVGRRVTEIFPGIDREPFNWIKMLGEVALTGHSIIIEEYFQSGEKWLRLEAYSPQKNFVASVTQDITKRKLVEEQLKYYADELMNSNTKLINLNDELRRTSLSDGLTGIANRRYFDDYLEKEWSRAKREKTALSLVMLDVDFFKFYNDTYGHITGDECLKRIASMLKVLPRRAADLVARYGGEEFVIVLPDTDKRGAAVVGEKVRVGVEKLGIEHKTSLISEHVTVSVGISIMVPKQDDLSPIIIEAADRALYEAKGAGRNKVKVAEKSQ